MNSKNLGTTLKTRPVSIPQNAACSVMRLLQMLISPTGPQDEANTVAMNVVSQKILGGKISARISATEPIASIIRRLKRRVFSSSPVLWMPISLLALKPTSDRKVDADDRMAAMMPASINAPSHSGIIVRDAQIDALSGGSRFGSPRLMTAPRP